MTTSPFGGFASARSPRGNSPARWHRSPRMRRRCTGSGSGASSSPAFARSSCSPCPSSTIAASAAGRTTSGPASTAFPRRSWRTSSRWIPRISTAASGLPSPSCASWSKRASGRCPTACCAGCRRVHGAGDQGHRRRGQGDGRLQPRREHLRRAALAPARNARQGSRVFDEVLLTAAFCAALPPMLVVLSLSSRRSIREMARRMMDYTKQMEAERGRN